MTDADLLVRAQDGELERPIRIRRRRTKGWRMPKGAVYVGRPTKWGNPFSGDTAYVDFAAMVADGIAKNGAGWIGYCRTLQTMELLTLEDVRRELRGKDLACWCSLDQSCHADILLELANDIRPAQGSS